MSEKLKEGAWNGFLLIYGVIVVIVLAGIALVVLKALMVTLSAPPE